MGRRMHIGAGDLPRRPLADKILHSECNGTSAQKGYLPAIQGFHDGEDI